MVAFLLHCSNKHSQYPYLWLQYMHAGSATAPIQGVAAPQHWGQNAAVKQPLRLTVMPAKQQAPQIAQVVLQVSSEGQ
jgi:hypothetical protein